MKSPLIFGEVTAGLQINLTLPFSWQVFFFAALSASVANLLFFAACPELIRRFPTFAAFLREGRDFAYLRQYAEQSGALLSQDVLNNIENSIHFTDPVQGRVEVQIAFWQAFDYDNVKLPLFRQLCLVFYGFAMYGIAIVLWQNIIFVFDQVKFPLITGAP